MCGGGGAGGSNTQKYEWNDTMAPKWADALSWGNSLKDPSGFGAYKPYQGNDPNARIAGMTGDQQTAFQELRNMNAGTANPLPAVNAAIGQTTDTLTGQYLGGDKMNPYAGQNNPWADAMINNNTNQYVGDSPQFEHMLHSGQEDIARSYQQGTAADTTRMFNLSGAFGGSAHQNAVANNEYGLAKQLGNYTAGMQNDQYNRSAGLTDAQLGRDLQADTTNKSLGQSSYDSYLNRGSGSYEAERQRQMGAIGAGNDQQNLGFQRANALLGVGDANRGYNQDILNLNYNNTQDMNNQQYKMADWYTGLLGRAQGGMSPNMTANQAGYSASPFSQILGAGLLGRAGGLY